MENDEFTKLLEVIVKIGENDLFAKITDARSGVPLQHIPGYFLFGLVGINGRFCNVH